MMLSILYQDDHLLAINKPAGLLVHRSPIDKHETQFAVQLLRDQIGQAVYPIHRLDKPTSGVLLFALNADVVRTLSATWGEVEKTYWAITRGKVTPRLIDHPITTKPDKGDTFTQPKVQTAQTHVDVLSTVTLNVGFGKSAKEYPTTNFSFIELKPQTGRKHQIRKHLKHINHPIIGDTRYGRGEINRYFRQQHHVNRLLLHCRQIQFAHPVSERAINVVAPVDATWQALVERLSFRPTL